jgi:hypothetical protein
MKPSGSGTILQRVIQPVTVAVFVVVMFYEFKDLPWRDLWADLFTWRTFCGLVLSFLTTWLIARLDHGARLVDVVTDIPTLVVGMFFSAGILWLLYSLLRRMFEPN